MPAPARDAARPARPRVRQVARGCNRNAHASPRPERQAIMPRAPACLVQSIRARPPRGARQARKRRTGPARQTARPRRPPRRTSRRTRATRWATERGRTWARFRRLSAACGEPHRRARRPWRGSSFPSARARCRAAGAARRPAQGARRWCAWPWPAVHSMAGRQMPCGPGPGAEASGRPLRARARAGARWRAPRRC